MAYVKDIAGTCANPTCTKPATVEVFNRLNALCGKYCRKHGEHRATALSKTEASA